jgi:hypothetical protein
VLLPFHRDRLVMLLCLTDGDRFFNIPSEGKRGQ